MLSGYGSAYNYNGVWVWNPMFGMYTYLPLRGYGYSPYGGVVLYSPVTYWQQYATPVVMNTASSFNDNGARTAVSSPAYATSSAPAAGAPALPAATAPAVATPNVGSGSGGDAHRR
jgi:hypothetical protein